MLVNFRIVYGVKVQILIIVLSIAYLLISLINIGVVILINVL